jgi:hypothetical protein
MFLDLDIEGLAEGILHTKLSLKFS